MGVVSERMGGWKKVEGLGFIAEVEKGRAERLVARGRRGGGNDEGRPVRNGEREIVECVEDTEGKEWSRMGMRARLTSILFPGPACPALPSFSCLCWCAESPAQIPCACCLRRRRGRG